MKGSRLARDAQPDPVSKTNKLQQGLMRRLHQIGVNTPRESAFTAHLPNNRWIQWMKLSTIPESSHLWSFPRRIPGLGSHLLSPQPTPRLSLALLESKKWRGNIFTVCWISKVFCVCFALFLLFSLFWSGVEKIKSLNKLFFKSPIGLSQKQPVTLTNRSAALEALASYLSMESASVTKLLKQELLEPLFPRALCTNSHRRSSQ